MALKDLLNEYRFDEEFIYEGLLLDISVQLKKLMEEKGITKKELAERMGVSPSYITKIFGGSNISLKTIAKVLSALEVDATLEIRDRNKTAELKVFKPRMRKTITPYLEEGNESSFVPIAG